eukprot:TRINITY_DN4121_c0_g1_i9.p1 TRINITY_DN4121_c0_g1~~TRINITY_DN4121_c0_g1_i9.p1  ORF type:complete len:319 (-),score=78.85 TRINITY_DN4121_c0_g1_i9:2121-3077(-)
MSDKKLTSAKLQSFSQGFQTKNLYLKTQLEKQRRQKEEEDAAAAIYEDFVKSFEVEEKDSKSKLFLRGGTFNQETKSTTLPDPKTEKEYKPAMKFGVPSAAKPQSSAQSKVSALFADDEPSAAAVPEKEEPKKKRTIEMMIEEMKREQENKEKKVKPDGTPLAPGEAFPGAGSFDTGDPSTTNLYVGNVHPNITEEMLYKEFRQYGEIASIKIMWPRTEDEHKRARNCAFVAYMRREDAEIAREELNNFDMLGMELRVGWGKAVPVPKTPVEPHMVSKILGQSTPAPAPVLFRCTHLFGTTIISVFHQIVDTIARYYL